MEYEVRPTRVGTRSRRPAVAGAIGLVAFLVAAVVIATTSSAPSSGHADRVAIASPAPTASPTVAPIQAATTDDIDLASIRDLDDSLVRCHGMDRPGCQLLARVAATFVTGTLDGSSAVVKRVDVSASLLCNSEEDCPRAVLGRTNPLGSAIVELYGHPAAVWVNVTRILAPGGAMHAWIIRWADAPKASLGLAAPRSRLISR